MDWGTPEGIGPEGILLDTVSVGSIGDVGSSVVGLFRSVDWSAVAVLICDSSLERMDDNFWVRKDTELPLTTDDRVGFPVGRISPRTEVNLDRSGAEAVVAGLGVAKVTTIWNEDSCDFPADTGTDECPKIDDTKEDAAGAFV
jgi:hypothetical protein